MKKIVLMIFMCGMFTTYAAAQDLGYDKFQIELQGGLVRPAHNFSGIYVPVEYADFGGFKVGLRYSFNEYLGLKGSFVYDLLKNTGWETTHIGGDLEGTINMGRVLNFQTWTKRLNVIAHGGFGIGSLSYDRTNVSGDMVASGVAGLTGLVKITDKVSLFLDGSARLLFKQNLSFDGGAKNASFRPAIYSAHIGFTISLGKKGRKSADWYIRESALTPFVNDINALRQEVNNSNKNIESNKSAINALSNRVDGLESRIKTIETKDVAVPEQDALKQLLKGGALNTFFAFDSHVPYDSNITTLFAVVKYLQSNNVNVVLSGYADERGSDKYNVDLSLKRAEKVKEMLVDCGINPSRIETKGVGKDLSLESKNDTSYQMSRRVEIAVK